MPSDVELGKMQLEQQQKQQVEITTMGTWKPEIRSLLDDERSSTGFRGHERSSGRSVDRDAGIHPLLRETARPVTGSC